MHRVLKSSMTTRPCRPASWQRLMSCRPSGDPGKGGASPKQAEPGLCNAAPSR